MFKLIFEKKKEISGVDAMDLLEFNTYEAQRSLRPRHVKMLRREMDLRQFLTGNIAIATLLYQDKRRVLVNGQHQLHALLLGDMTIRVNYQEYACENAIDLAILYRCFDNHAARSLGDILASEALALGIDWKIQIVRLVVSAVAFAQGKADLPKIEKVKFLSLYKTQGAFVNNVIGKRDSKHLMRACVVKAMMDTFDKDWQSAKIFWEDVRDGAELKKDDPALLLSKYLQSSTMSSNSRRVASPSDIVSAREMYVKCIHAWNATRRGTKTSLRFISNAPVPALV